MIKKIPYADHDEWLAIRKQYIGGSDAGAIVGMNPYSSPFAVWAEKTGNVKPFEGNTITKVGSYLEELVADMFEEEQMCKVRRCNFTLVNDKYPWACANIDRDVVGEDAILEIKTTNSFVAVKKFRQGDYPEAWYAQMTHYLAVTGRARAYLAVLSECKDFRIFTLERDDAEIATLMDAEKVFWEKYVQTGKTPPADGLDATSNAIKEMFMTDSGDTADLSGMESFFQQRAILQKQIKQLKEQQDDLDNQIKLVMGSASKGICGPWTVSWKLQNTGGLDREAIRKDFPTLNFDNYAKSQTRVFRVSEKRSQ
jgi:putative phage-type endonuclease